MVSSLTGQAGNFFRVNSKQILKAKPSFVGVFKSSSYSGRYWDLASIN